MIDFENFENKITAEKQVSSDKRKQLCTMAQKQNATDYDWDAVL